ncbi:hypothetical protein [Pseudomonas entomophila]|uniref:hypothetical protein n=1 Tax=Pseudomonas entomophila TaxID=312306 RepID=UPI003EBBAAA8
MSSNVKLRNPYNPNTTEGKWVIFQHSEGMTVDEIVENVKKNTGYFAGSEENTRLIVEYQIGKRQFTEIEHLLLPHEPKSIEYVENTQDGHLCRTIGAAEACFDVLIKAPNINEQELRTLINEHPKEISWLAYKNAHEGYPFGYSLPGDRPLDSRTALSGITLNEIERALKS